MLEELQLGGLNITPEEQGTIDEETAFYRGEDLDENDPKDVRREFERERRYNNEVFRRRGNTVF